MAKLFSGPKALCTKCMLLHSSFGNYIKKTFEPQSHWNDSRNIWSWSRKKNLKYTSPTSFHYSSQSTDDDMTIEDDVLDNKETDNFLRQYHRIPNTGHRLFVIHPAIRYGPDKPKLTTPELEMDEACALVNTLQNWKVVEKRIIKVDSQKTKQIFGPTKFVELAGEVINKKTVTAVFLNVSRLKSIQITEFQQHWRVPVFDRYSIILQIFKEHAHTKISKLQVALAEIPYIRGRLDEIHLGKEDKQTGHTDLVGGREQKSVYIRKEMLREREAKLKKALAKVQQHREMLRSSRKKKELPTVAVVGYTNSGKTTLIKALTGDEKMIPENHLFATLDVTAHGGLLPNKMTVIYVDTVGFIANLHHKLIDAFSATLEDALVADVVIHLRDISHPDTENQKVNVLKTLSDKLSEEQMRNIIEVCNKADKVPVDAVINVEFPVSAVTGQGLDKLLNKIQQKMFEDGTVYMEKKLKIPSSGDHLSWLCQEAQVQDIQTDSDGNLIVSVIITRTAYQKFKNKFQKERSKQGR